MTAPTTLPTPLFADPWDMLHLVCCCTDLTAICGYDVSDLPWSNDRSNPCLACFQVEDDPCPFCGCVDCEGESS